jgi:hypothetical protein
MTSVFVAVVLEGFNKASDMEEAVEAASEGDDVIGLTEVSNFLFVVSHPLSYFRVYLG